MKMLDGNISIHAVTSGPEKKVCIWIEDKDSTIQILEIEMTMKDFALALTGQSYIPMKFHLSDTTKVGMQHEVKQMFVTFNRSDFENVIGDDIEIDRAIKKYEVNGWIGSRKDAKNYHNLVSGSGIKTEIIYRISFHRWVEQ